MTGLKGYFKHVFAGMVLGVLISFTTYNTLYKIILLSILGIIYILLDNLFKQYGDK